MIVLSANNVTKTYGIDTIIDKITFMINEKDKVGLIGSNGAGKTTLLKILTGEIQRDSGDVYTLPSATIGCLHQNGNFDSNNTVFDELLLIFKHLTEMEAQLEKLTILISEQSGTNQSVEKLLNEYAHLSDLYKEQNGYGYISEIKGMLTNLGFTEDYYGKKISTLSGGEKTRLSLGSLLLKKPSILFLDEPTNHLDVDTLKWLEQYLKAYNGTILVISHDRYFLDQIVNRIFEIENTDISIYDTNYSGYVERKKALEAAEQKKFEKQQKEIEKQEELIRKFKQHGTEKLANRAKSREKMLDHIERMEKPTILNDKIKISFKAGVLSGKDALFAEDLSKAYEGKPLFKNVTFDIKRGEKICLIGPNGIGKTTLLKMILNEIPTDTGIIRPGQNVHFGYYDQEQQVLSSNNTVLEELHSDYRLYTETELRNILGRFLFKGDDVFKQVSSLSGGEKSRLSLLKIMLSGSNFLLMDEPTNHLDISSKEVFEDALRDFPGTLLMVSHDRYFLNKIPSRILELTSEGMTEYLGAYDYYREKKAESLLDAIPQPETGLTKTKIKEDKRKEKDLLQQERQIKRQHAELEKTINSLESLIQSLHEEMCKEEIFSNPQKMRDTDEKLKLAEKNLSEAYDKWLG